MLKEYKEILEVYLDTVETGALKVLLYDQRSDIVCRTATHPWTYLFVKFSEFEKNANKGGWRIVYSKDVKLKAAAEAKESP